jgi:hypothetical protein
MQHRVHGLTAEKKSRSQGVRLGCICREAHLKVLHLRFPINPFIIEDKHQILGSLVRRANTEHLRPLEVDNFDITVDGNRRRPATNTGSNNIHRKRSTSRFHITEAGFAMIGRANREYIIYLVNTADLRCKACGLGLAGKSAFVGKIKPRPV